MAIKQQLFSPDTCTCEVLEEWDDAVPEDQRVHTLVSIQRRGAEHAAILDASLYATIREENVRKNKAWNKAAELSGKTSDRVAWSFDAGRTLVISFPQDNVPVSVKQQIQAWCDSNLGLGKVIVT